MGKSLTTIRPGSSGLGGEHGGWRLNSPVSDMILGLGPETVDGTPRSIKEIVRIRHTHPGFSSRTYFEVDHPDAPDVTNPNEDEVLRFLLQIQSED